MMKFTLKFLLIFSLFSLNLFGSELSQSINQILSINNKLSIIYEQNIDKNSTDSDDFKALQSDKTEIIAKLPALITSSKDFNLTSLNSYAKALQTELNKYSKNINSKNHINTQIAVASNDLDIVLYSTLAKINQAFKELGKNPDDAIINAITQTQISHYQDLKSLKSSLGDDINADVKAEFTSIDIKRYSYDEILNYLKDHSELFSSNILITGLNLQKIIDTINSYSPEILLSINPGKSLIIILLCGFFMLLPKLAYVVVYRVFISFLSKQKEIASEFKEQFVSAIKLPVNLFFIIYALDLALTIAYYPATFSINVVNYFSIAYTIVIAWFMLGILDGYGIVLLAKIAQKSGRKEVINLIIKIVYFIVIIITILLILRRMGFDISTIIASLGIGGLAVALATKDIIANFFASILLLFDSSFSQGDWIVCSDVEGTVVEIGLRKTTIRTFDNALVFVPNSKIMSENIKNWNRRKVGRQIKMKVGLSYTTSKESIQKCIDDIKYMLMHHPDIAKSGVDTALNSKDARVKYRQNMVSMDDLSGYKNNLFVVLDEFGDSSINILIYCFSKSVVWGEFLATKEDVMLKIMEIVERYDDASFAFPSQSIYVESMPKIQIYKGENDDKQI